MGIPEMVKVTSMASSEMGKKNDILLLDTCSFITITTGVVYHLKLMTHYYHLGFIQDNCWASLLNDQPVDANRIFAMQKEQKERLILLQMNPQEVCESISIMNPNLDESPKSNILEILYYYKKWAL